MMQTKLYLYLIIILLLKYKVESKGGKIQCCIHFYIVKSIQKKI